MKSRMAILAIVMTAFFLGGCHKGGSSAAFPRKSMKVICPWAPGGGTDQTSLFWAAELKKLLGKPVTKMNRTGGSGVTGHTAGASAPADGHTLTMITAELNTMHLMGLTTLTHHDFRCILQMNADAAAIIVRDDSPWQTLDDMLDHIRTSPVKVKMSGTATRGTWDLARIGLLLEAKLPVDSVIWVPSEGAGPSKIALLGGHVDVVCCSVPEVATVDAQTKNPKISAGMRVLAVMSDERLPDFPDVPTARECGVAWSGVGWRGLAVPKDTPDEVVALLIEKCNQIATSQKFRDFMKQTGYAIKIRSGDEFTQFLNEQDEQWKPVVEAAGYAKR